MKTSFLATPKKLLLATSILAMSSTAMAANSPILDAAVTDTLTVTANYVKLLTVELDTTSIEFGDVYTDSNVTAVSVAAAITGELGETFGYSIISDDAQVILAIAGTTTSLTGADTALTDGAAALNFTVDLDHANLTKDIDALVTVSVTYDSIDEVETITRTPAA